MENGHPVGVSWGNAVITGGSEPPMHSNSSQTDMRVKAPLITECSAVSQGLDPKTHCFYWEPSQYKKCFHLKFEEYCDKI